MIEQYVQIFIKFFFLFTPFFLLSTFLTMTQNFNSSQRKQVAVKVAIAVVIISLVLFYLGNYIFMLFGITLDSFRIGTGILLFLSAAAAVQGTGKDQVTNHTSDISVVPLAIPITVGPATTGALLVMGGELRQSWDKFIGVAAICTAIIAIGIMLYLGNVIERLIKKQGLTILAKITGLVLAALAAQMVMTGVLGFLGRT